MPQLVIQWRELRELHANMVGLWIVNKLMAAGAPVRLKKTDNPMIGITKPLTDEDVVFIGPMMRLDSTVHPLSIMFKWGKEVEEQLKGKVIQPKH